MINSALAFGIAAETARKSGWIATRDEVRNGCCRKVRGGKGRGMTVGEGSLELGDSSASNIRQAIFPWRQESYRRHSHVRAAPF